MSPRPVGTYLGSRRLLACLLLVGTAPAMAADPTGPAIESIRVPAAGTYANGATLAFEVVFDEPVEVTGAPTLPVEIGFAVRRAELVRNTANPDARTLRFETTVPAHARDDDGIALGTVGVREGAAVRSLSGAEGIVDRAWNPAMGVLPASVETGQILVDAVGPGVRGYRFQDLPADTIPAGGRIAVEVSFDQPVAVTGAPTIPFRIGATPESLSYAGGSGTDTLAFAFQTTADVDPRDVGFRSELGEVVYLPEATATIRDQLGNEPSWVRGPTGETLIEDGNRVVVLGAHRQFLRTVDLDELRNVLNVESKAFVAATDPPPSYVPPAYEQPRCAVDLHKITYNSVVPEHGNRPTTATGLVAIPVPSASEAVAGGPVARPMVSYQHGTVYGLHEVPSYAFSMDRATPGSMGAFETRLAVAQFAGQGFVVIAADYFGMGDSTEPDAYAVKGSEQQATLDLLRRSSGLIEAEEVEVSHLLLSGWSQGGLVTMAFLEALEREGIAVTGASTASAPSDLLGATSTLLFNRRDASSPTPDAPWINTILMIAAFSYEGYHARPGLAFHFLNPEFYEAARRVYTRDYDLLDFDRSNGDLLVYVAEGDHNPIRIPADLTRLLRPECFDPHAVAGAGPRFYPFTEIARFFRDASAYQWVMRTPVQLNYGTNDEAFSTEVALIAFHYQGIINKTSPIVAVPVEGGNHRGTFLTAVDRQRYWFNLLVGRDPGPKPDGLPPT